MRKLDLSAVTTGIAFPFKRGTGDFLQQAFTELFGELMLSKIGASYSASVAYVIYGCKQSVGGGNTTISKGAIFFNGEILLSPAQTFTTPVGPDVIIANILITQYTGNGVDADPVVFSDLNSRNVHNIRTVEYSDGTTGSGNISDYSSFYFLQDWDTITPSLVAVAGGGSVTADLADFTINRIKRVDNTVFWQVKIENVTISGTVSKIAFSILTPPFSEFVDAGQVRFLGLYNETATLYATLGSTTLGGSGFYSIILDLLGGGNFTTGTNDQKFEFSIFGEVI